MMVGGVCAGAVYCCWILGISGHILSPELKFSNSNGNASVPGTLHSGSSKNYFKIIIWHE